MARRTDISPHAGRRSIRGIEVPRGTARPNAPDYAGFGLSVVSARIVLLHARPVSDPAAILLTVSEACCHPAATSATASAAATSAGRRLGLFPARADPADPVPLAALAELAWALEPPSPADMPSLRRDDAALLLDGLLVRLARGRGALEVAIGDGLAALSEGDRALRLGYASLGDYARERLGIAGSTAEKLARLARALRERPLLAAAVRRGEVSARKAETIVPLARGEDEGAWVARAKAETVRALEAAVQSERPRSADDTDDERWERVFVASLAPGARERLDRALALAGKELGATAPRWQRIEALCTEFLGAHPVPARGERPDGTRHPTAEAERDALKAWLEKETAQWEFLESIEPCPAPATALDDGALPGPRADPFRLDEDLLRLAGVRARWDEVFGHVAMLLRMCGVWRDMHFVSFAHYCAERLGMAERTVGQRIALERRLYELPALRRALREGRLSYEKARLVARAASDDAAAAGWIDRAAGLPCVALRREVEAQEEAAPPPAPGDGAGPQMCARPALDLRLPTRVAALLDDAFQAARAAAGRWLRPGECLDALARHFLETWDAALAQRGTLPRRVLARDRGFCQVPGCSRAASHAHHVLYRSLGGDDDPANLVSLCAAHHLHGVHLGWLRVRGRAPDGLTWELGVRAGAPPLQVFTPAPTRAR
jgi:hypothetical protein